MYFRTSDKYTSLHNFNQVSCNQKTVLSACESHKETMRKVTSRNILMYYNYVCDYRSLSNFQDNKSGYVGGEMVLHLSDNLQDHNCIDPKWKAAKKQITFDIDSRF